MQVNFLPWRLLREKQWQRRWLGFSVGFLLLSGLSMGMVSRELDNQLSQLNVIDTSIKQQQLSIKKQIAVWKVQSEGQQQVRLLSSQASVLLAQSRERHHLLMHLAEWVSDDLWLIQVTDDGQRIHIEGHSLAYEPIVAFLARIRTYSGISHAWLDLAKTATSGETLHFVLMAEREVKADAQKQ